MSEKQNWPQKYDIEKLVTIPEDVDKIIDGKKTSVRRNDRYADKDDKLVLKGKPFVVKDIYPQKLRDITDANAREEGYESLAEYKEGLTGIHGGGVWDPEITVWVHELEPA